MRTNGNDQQWTSLDAVRKWTWGQSTGWSGNQGQVQFTYDLAGQPTSISDVDDRALLFDADGRLVGVNDANALYSQLYAYDKNARLTRADIGKWDAAQLYSYDAAGNRISLKDEQSLSGWRYGYGLNSNRLTDITAVVSVGSGVPSAPTYDAMGNMISDGQGQSLTYNTQGRLSAVDQTVYTYNAQGQRRTKDNGTKRAFIHDPMGRLLGEYVWNGSIWTADSEYIYLDNWRAVAVVRPDPITQMNTPRIHPIVSDHLGTPRKVLDGSTGQPLWSWDAKDPFGNEAPNENPSGMGVFTLDLRFPGQQFDTESGFFHNGFRTYHPKWGRYIQSDPLGLEAGWNTYVYVDNNTLMGSDPLGLFLIIIGTQQEVAYVNSQISDLSKRSSSASDVVREIRQSKTTYFIFPNSPTTYAQGRIIYYNPKETLVIADKEHQMCFTQEPAIGLIHEMVHVLGDKNMKAKLALIPDDRYRNKEEERAMRVENYIMRDLGLPARKHHYADDRYGQKISRGVQP